VPRHRDGDVFNISVRHKAEAENPKVITVAYEYTYQDHEYITGL